MSKLTKKQYDIVKDLLKYNLLGNTILVGKKYTIASNNVYRTKITRWNDNVVRRESHYQLGDKKYYTILNKVNVLKPSFVNVGDDEHFNYFDVDVVNLLIYENGLKLFKEVLEEIRNYQLNLLT